MLLWVSLFFQTHIALGLRRSPELFVHFYSVTHCPLHFATPPLSLSVLPWALFMSSVSQLFLRTILVCNSHFVKEGGQSRVCKRLPKLNRSISNCVFLCRKSTFLHITLLCEASRWLSSADHSSHPGWRHLLCAVLSMEAAAAARGNCELSPPSLTTM